MSEEAIVQNVISRLGQSQSEREAPELGAHHADVDERSTRDLLVYARRFAEMVRFHHLPGAAATGEDWTPFFAYDDAAAAALPLRQDGGVPAHLALFLAFLKLYEIPREEINSFTARHLDFFYREVLRFERRPAIPDRAHVLIELKKGSLPVRIGPGHLFSAGKSAAGELLYAPATETIVNSASVQSLRTVFVDRREGSTVRFAPVANSADGLGAPLPQDEPKFKPFGHRALPVAEIGCAVASPVLRMQEGRRRVTLSIRLSAAGLSRLTGRALAGAFRAFLTGDKSWLGPYGVTATLAGDRLQCQVDVPEADGAVVDYDPAIHAYAYSAQSPVLQLLLNAGASVGYADLKDVTVETAQITVDVSGVRSLTLESDAGSLDPKKAFLPFGGEPAIGSRFNIAFPEALSKNLSALKLTLEWQGAPASFASHYANYGVSGMGDAYFTASVSFRDGGSWDFRRTGIGLFAPRTGNTTVIDFTQPAGAPAPPSHGANVYALSSAGTSWARFAAFRSVLLSPVLFSFLRRPPETRSGFIVLELDRDFLHARYRKKSIENIVAHTTAPTTPLVVLNEPYTPALRGLSLAYTAQSAEVNVASASLDDFGRDPQFFHAGSFGQMREHGYQRAQMEFVADKRVPLLPQHDYDGELLIGVSGLQPRDSVSLLFQAAEGSADPDLEQQRIDWFVLCDNYWKRLGAAELARDTTNQLLRSGVVAFVIPREATTLNTIMPAGPVWLRAAVSQNTDAVSQLVQVAANAVEVQWIADRDDPTHLSAPLPSGKIGRLSTPIAQVKGVKQPYASAGGALAESDPALRTRAAERLRHRNRSIGAWDYERLVLDAFPAVHKVKCIPHAKDGSWLAPGHVLVVVVPDLRNRNAVDPLQPRVEADTISRIARFLSARCGMQVTVHVKNPRYQKVRLDFQVRFRAGYEFNFYSEQVKQELVRFLSPWAFDAERPIAFGGRIYKSVVLDFVEELPYVDFVTEFKMYGYSGDISSAADAESVRAETPDAILVSDAAHVVREVA